MRLFIMSRAVEFAVMPNAGGWYDQHPKLVDDWMYIFQKVSEHDQEEHAKQEQKHRRPGLIVPGR